MSQEVSKKELTKSRLKVVVSNVGISEIPEVYFQGLCLLVSGSVTIAPGAKNRVVLSQREAVASEAEAVAMPLVEVFRETSPG